VRARGPLLGGVLLALALAAAAVAAPGEERPTIALIASEDADVTTALARGLRRAFAESRDGGGPDLALVIGRPQGGWSSAAAPAVRLATSGRALALVTPPERATAHLLAQLGTRAHVPVIATSPARSVTGAGSTWVLSVAPRVADPDPETVGFDAGRALVEGVRRAPGAGRAGLIPALRRGGPVSGAEGRFGFDRLGNRVEVDDRVLRIALWCIGVLPGLPPLTAAESCR